MWQVVTSMLPHEFSICAWACSLHRYRSSHAPVSNGRARRRGCTLCMMYMARWCFQQHMIDGVWHQVWQLLPLVICSCLPFTILTSAYLRTIYIISAWRNWNMYMFYILYDWLVWSIWLQDEDTGLCIYCTYWTIGHAGKIWQMGVIFTWKSSDNHYKLHRLYEVFIVCLVCINCKCRVFAYLDRLKIPFCFHFIRNVWSFLWCNYFTLNLQYLLLL